DVANVMRTARSEGAGAVATAPLAPLPTAQHRVPHPAAVGPSVDLADLAGGSIGDFIALMKPRVMALVIFTAVVGMVLAPAGQHPALAVIALICIAVGAGAAGALNMWYDADIDARMQRTAARP